MGRGLTVRQRAKMPKRDFAGPGRSFPENDKKHDRLAIGGATRSYNAGNISKSTEERIKAEARRKLGDKPMAGKSAKQAQKDTKRDVNEGTRAAPSAGEAQRGGGKNRHGLQRLEHKGPMPQHSVRYEARNHHTVEGTRGMPSLNGGQNGKKGGGDKMGGNKNSNWPC